MQLEQRERGDGHGPDGTGPFAGNLRFRAGEFYKNSPFAEQQNALLEPFKAMAAHMRPDTLLCAVQFVLYRQAKCKGALYRRK